MRRAGIALLSVVGLAFSVFGIDDLRMESPPPTHQAYFERLPNPVPQELQSLILFMFDAQGGLFLGAGIALLVLLAGPIRKGDRWALLAALAIVLFGNAGIILGLRNMQAPHDIPVALLVVGIAGCALAAVRPRAA